MNWETLNYIEYLDYRFPQDDIKSGSLLLNRDLTCASLAIDTFSPVVECNDTAILDFERDTPLYYYRAGRLWGVFYVQNIERIAATKYKITAQSAIALLDRGRHMGGIYTGEEAGEVLPDICGAVPISIKTSLAKQKLYGWLPIATPRANLSQALFALGAAIRTGLDGSLHAAFLWDGLSGVVVPDHIYRDGRTVRAGGKVTQVALTEHQYMEGGEVKTLFEGTSQQGDPITFDGPMYDLEAVGFEILEQGANYAILSAGSGTLTGRAYIHNTRLVTRSLWQAPDPNLKEFPDATLVSLVNSSAVADRLENYYKHNQTVEESIVFTGQACGDLLDLPDPFDAVQTTACLESAAVNLSATLKAQITAVKGFVPIKAEDVGIYDAQELITVSMEYEIPDGVTHITCVLMSGGDGGGAGYDGESGEGGTSASVTSGQTGTKQGKAGAGGEGGAPGIPGAGGKIIRLDLDVEPGDKLIIEVGAGGAPGEENGAPGQPGAATRLIYKGEVYSSEDGASSGLGFTDLMTGTVYAASGAHGKKGGSGGKGGIGGASADPAQAGEDVSTASGGNPGENFVKRSSSQKLGTNPTVSQSWRGTDMPAIGKNTYTGSPSYSVGNDGRITLSGTTTTIGFLKTVNTPSGGYNQYTPGTVYRTPTNETPTISTPTVYSRTVEYKVTADSDGRNGQLYTRQLDVVRQYPVYKVDLVAGTYGSGGGGAANGADGSDATVESDRTRGGDGADALPPEAATIPGTGGDAGHGGGGSGGGGAGEATATGTAGDLIYSYTGYGGEAGTPGKGSRGAPGTNGAALLYFGIARTLKSGPVMDRNNRFILDRFGRRIIV